MRRRLLDFVTAAAAIAAATAAIWSLLCWLGNRPPLHFLLDIWEQFRRA